MGFGLSVGKNNVNTDIYPYFKKGFFNLAD